MMERKADRVWSITLSIIVHLAIVGALVWGWVRYRQPAPTPQSLAIEGTVVNNRSAPSPPVPPTSAPPAPAQPQPPQPTPEEQRRAAEQVAAQEAEQHQREEQARVAAEKAAADKAVADKAATDRASAERAATEKTASDKAASEKSATEKAAAQKAAAAKVAAEKAAADKAAADKAAADKAAADKAAADKADAARKAQEQAKQQAEQERARREADLRAQMAAEEHENAVQASPARAQYLSLITARINHAWIRPPSARSGVKCTVHITQVPGGVVTKVSVTGCNGDDSVRQSVETAAYRASPLPAPADPALFDPNIDVTFAPDE